MGGKRLLATISLLAGAGLLTGCCLFSGNPTVTITVSPASVTVGQPVVLTARPEGGKPPYTYEWSGVMGSGKTVTATFQSAGQYPVSVTVTDSCGKTAEDETIVIVTGESPGGSLTGNWVGTLTTNAGVTYTITLSLTQSGTQVIGTLYRGAWAMPGTGSYIGGTLVFNFQWFGTGAMATLTASLQGIYLVGDIILGTDRVATVRLQR